MEKDEDTEKVKNLMKDLFTANPQHNEENPLEKKKKKRTKKKKKKKKKRFRKRFK